MEIFAELKDKCPYCASSLLILLDNHMLTENDFLMTFHCVICNRYWKIKGNLNQTLEETK